MSLEGTRRDGDLGEEAWMLTGSGRASLVPTVSSSPHWVGGGHLEHRDSHHGLVCPSHTEESFCKVPERQQLSRGDWTQVSTPPPQAEEEGGGRGEGG